jgi:hypothetical protein
MYVPMYVLNKTQREDLFRFKRFLNCQSFTDFKTIAILNWFQSITNKTEKAKVF